MLGLVITHLRQKVTWLKTQLIALALTLKSQLRIFGVSVINLMIRFVIHISKRCALILWNTARKVVPNTMKEAYHRAEIIVAHPKLGQTGLTQVVLVFLYPLRVLVLLLHKLGVAIKDIMEK
jgi:hypothetical protein